MTLSQRTLLMIEQFDIPKIVSGPVEMVYKGKSIKITDENMELIKGWHTAYNNELERHRSAMRKLEEDLDKIMGF